MAPSRSRPVKRRPQPPDLPARLDPAPAVVEGVWDCVAAGPDVQVPEHVPDLRIQESRLVGTSLAGSRLTGLECRDTEFVQCDLSGAVLADAVLTRVRVTDCRLTGTAFDGAQLTDVQISDSAADLAGFRMTRARLLLIEGTGLRGADLYEFDGEHCAFLRCDLAEANLDSARLRETDLHGSTLDDVRGALPNAPRTSDLGPRTSDLGGSGGRSARAGHGGPAELPANATSLSRVRGTAWSSR